ncbi:MAG: phosphoenolpyruvate--protein phosphotransferase [Magnetospirillum sp. WYHS-4]
MIDGAAEMVFEGLGVSPGIGVGVAFVREAGMMSAPEYRIAAARVPKELDRFRAAQARARRQIGQLRSKARAAKGSQEDLQDLLDAYIQMLKDSRLVRGVLVRIERDRVNAESAVQAELADIAEQFSAMDDPYIKARVEDIRAVAQRLQHNLHEAPRNPFANLPKNSIVVAEDLSPADTAQLDPANVVGFATLLGGAEGHTAIMARALGIPAVLGVAGLMRGVRAGTLLIVDGAQGRVILNPSADTLEAYRRRKSEGLREERTLARLRRQPSVTRDGIPVTLMANVELPIQMGGVVQVGAAGIGLLRSEFLFMNRETIPTEDEQYELLRGVVERMDGKPVTVRTLDVGGEKTSAALMGDYADTASSALGLRGIRLSLVLEEVLETQFRAVLRAGAHGPVRILLPMVTTVSEVRRARDVLARAVKRLKRRKASFANPLPPLGVMIEVPGAALSADSLARACDFFSIGSNDLTMYTLAIDRTDEHVAHLYDPLNPAVLRLIQFAATAAHRAGIPIGICGEIAGDPRYTALLLGLGLRELSMTASSIPRVKQRLHTLDVEAAIRRATLIMDQVDSGRITMLLEDFNALA